MKKHKNPPKARGPIRLEDIFQPDKRRPTVKECLACGMPTREGKAYCIEHIHLLDYAHQVQEQQAAISRELKKTAKGGKIPEKSQVVASILKTLSVEGSLPLRELADQTDVPFDLIGIYVKRMHDLGLVDVQLPSGKRIKTKLVSLSSPKQVLSTQQVAETLGVSRRTVGFWITKGLPIYHKGKRGQESFFDLSVLKQWYADFKKKDSAKRRAQTKGDWNQIYKVALAQGVDAAAEQFGLNKAVVRRKIHAMGAPLLTPVSHRKTSVTDAAKAMGVYPVTVFKWLSRGAPHDRLVMAHKKRPRLLVNLEEIKAWHKGRLEALKDKEINAWNRRAGGDR